MMELFSFFLALLCLTIVNGQGDVSNSDGSLNETDSNDISIENRIYGGLVPARNQFTFVARLQVYFNTGRSVVCSGVALNNRVIITVAHCLVGPGGEKANNVNARFSTGSSIRFQKDEVNVHPAFDGNGYGADIGFLRKKTNSPFYVKVGEYPSLPNQLPDENVALPAEGTPAITVGWGKYRAGGNLNFDWRLHYASVSILGDSCTERYPTLSAGMNENELICTFNNVAGLCAGDWGGPLFIRENNNLILQGLNMYKRGDCDNDGYPSAYFNLQTVSNWIKTSSSYNDAF